MESRCVFVEEMLVEIVYSIIDTVIMAAQCVSELGLTFLVFFLLQLDQQWEREAEMKKALSSWLQEAMAE